MARIFTLVSIIAVSMVLLAGGGIYWLAVSEIGQSKKDSTIGVAQGIASGISAKIQLLNYALDNIAQAPELNAAIDTGNQVEMEKLLTQFSRLLPGMLNLRFLPPDTNAPDRSTVPNLGFADVEMVQAALQKNPPPMIQGDQGPNRHLAIARRVVRDGRVIGVLLASMNYDFLEKNIAAASLPEGLIELKQDRLVLGASGDQSLRDNNNSEQIKIPETEWILQLWFPQQVNFNEPGLLVGILIIPSLVACLAFFVGYRRFSELLRQDQSSVLKAVKDLMGGHLQGSYPVNIDEMRVIISTVVQFKRVLDGDHTKSAAEPDEELDIDDFFANEPEVMGFLSEDSGIEVVHSSSFDKQKKSQSQPETASADKQPAEFPLPGAATNPASTSIFRAYDIRGIVNESLTTDVVFDIGRAFASEAKNKGCKTVILGRDGRKSSPALSDSFAQGVVTTGMNVLDIGLVPTPMLYFVTHHYEGHSGAMITGSHNPVNYNGVKLVVDGKTLSGESIKMLQKRIDNQDFALGETGSMETSNSYINEYIGVISDDIHIARPMLVVVDCGNGAAGELAPTLLKTLGCEVVELFCDIDGAFPNHHPDPGKPENLVDLISAVKHYKADVGLAFDGDGDRLGVIDDQGKIIWPDRQMMLFAREILTIKPGAEIIFDVKCSSHLAEQITKYGGRPLMWKTGHSFLKAKIRERGAVLGGEMSGHICFNDRWYGFDDALYAACRLIEILSVDNRSSSAVFAEFPDSINTPELTVELPEGENFKLVEAMCKAVDFKDGKMTTIDGLRVDFSEGWGLVRASNTTPSLVFRFEAESPEAMQKIQQRFRQLTLQIKPDIALPF